MKIIVNRCYGGIGFSKKVFNSLGIKWTGYGYIRNEELGIKDKDDEIWRTNKRLIKAVESIGIKESSGELAELEIVEIPDGIQFEIDNYDGVETIHEIHRSW